MTEVSNPPEYAKTIFIINRQFASELTSTHPNRKEESANVFKHCQKAKNRYNCGMILEKFPEVQRLSASEKLIFVSELWNDLEAHPAEVPVSREIIAELERRTEYFRQHPDEFTTWEAVKERVLASSRR